ncbi:YdcF family protein [Nocardia altamirensis]|uniref:YdcF family protein n=1 Tax=Nocardia altamirensis TaxID=472158 RepID=UPI00350E4085
MLHGPTGFHCRTGKLENTLLPATSPVRRQETDWPATAAAPGFLQSLTDPTKQLGGVPQETSGGGFGLRRGEPSASRRQTRGQIVEESTAGDTKQNAQRTAEILRNRGMIPAVVLVTSGCHMARATSLFEGAGVTVVRGVKAPGDTSC